MALTEVNSIGIKDDSIVNADIKSDAAIALSKLASTPAVLTGSTNNTITTVTGANAIAGEATLTYDGTTQSLLKFSNNANSSILEFNKSRNGSVGGNTVVQDDDAVGVIRFLGADGTDYSQVADIQAAIDGTPGDNDTPGRISFSTTADGAQYTTERLRITSDGKVGLNEDTPVGDLHITTAGSSQEDGVLYIGGSNSTLGLQLSYDQSGNTSAKITTNSNYSNASSKLSICVDENANDDQLVLTGDGNVKIGDGNLIIGTSGHGIDFSADGNAGGMTSELFDDYERGGWTPNPIYYDGNNWVDAPFSVGSVYGYYVKSGDLVFIYGYLDTMTFSNTYSNAAMEGLPFTSANTFYGATIQPAHSNIFGNTNGGNFYIGANKTIMYSNQYGDSDYNYCSWSGSSGRYMMFSGCYQAA